jgi:hypothetical protein
VALSPEQLRLREGKIGASFVPYLMAGKTERIRKEWALLVGHPGLEEREFDQWNYKYGEVIEPLALNWHETKTGQALTRRGEVVTHPKLKHVCCTLDCWRAADNFVIDCKAWSSWQKIDYICSFLMPQIIVQRACTEAAGGALLIVHGGAEPVEYPLTWEADYEAQVWERIAWFWDFVQSLQPPVALGALDAPVPAVKTYEMTQSNSWAEAATIWRANRDAARAFEGAAKDLKALVPDDAKRAHGHGIQVDRNKAGSLSIKEQTA